MEFEIWLFTECWMWGIGCFAWCHSSQKVKVCLRRDRDQPRPKTLPMCHDRHLVAPRCGLLAITHRLFHGILNVQPLNSLHLEMNERELLANHIGCLSRSGILLSPTCAVSVGPEFVAPLAFSPFSFFS